MILISACLAGVNCKYSGGNNEVPELKKLWEEGKAVLVCPEVMGGLSTPRIPCEIRNGRVYNTEGEDKTENYVRGAEKALKICLENNCRIAVLKANSPSCGPDEIYDGTFTHTKIKGSGIFAAMLKEKGIPCISEKDDLKILNDYL
jgi:uncharacterized protein YbbK (DUF523 family)